MNKSIQYRETADECLRLALRAVDRQSRAILLKMSELWLRLAALADRYGEWAEVRSERDLREG
jgi:hypothetical protein